MTELDSHTSYLNETCMIEAWVMCSTSTGCLHPVKKKLSYG